MHKQTQQTLKTHRDQRAQDISRSIVLFPVARFSRTRIAIELLGFNRMAGGHVRVPTDEEECHHEELPAFNEKSRCRKRGACGVVLGLFFFPVLIILILLGTSRPEGAALKAFIMKISSDRLRSYLAQRQPPRAAATGLCTNGKFKNDPRIRREWRELGNDELKAVQEAFWRLRGFKRVASGGNKAGFAPDSEWNTTLKGQAKCAELNEGIPAAAQNPYCGYFTNYDEIVALHACSVKDPRCDQGHTGPHFMNFHRMVILKLVGDFNHVVCFISCIYRDVYIYNVDIYIYIM